MSPYRGRPAVTLIEVLVVLGVLGVLVGLLMPAVADARRAAARAACQNSMRQLGLGLHTYHDQFGSLPPKVPAAATNSSPEVVLGWMVLILPMLEQDELYRQAVRSCAVDPNPLHAAAHPVLTSSVRALTCPADGRLSRPLRDDFGLTLGYTSYIGIAGSLAPGARVGHNGLLGLGHGGQFGAVRDGLSNTILLVERPPPDNLQAGWWYPGFHGYGPGSRGPNNGLLLGGGLDLAGDPCLISRRMFGPGQLSNPCDRYHVWSLHPGGANFLFCDGSVRFLPYSAHDAVPALASPAGGEVIPGVD